MLVTTTSTLQDRRIDEYMGVVSGEAILGANAFRDMAATGGEHVREAREHGAIGSANVPQELITIVTNALMTRQ